MLAVLKMLNLAIAFLLELCMLAAIGYWGYHIKAAHWLKITAAIGLPLLAAVIWGIFLAPKSVIVLDAGLKMGGKALLFAIAVLLLYNAGRTTLATWFAIVAAMNILLILSWKQHLTMPHN